MIFSKTTLADLEMDIKSDFKPTLKKNKKLPSEMVGHQHIRIKQYNKELDEADAVIDRGEFYTQEEVERRSKTW